MMKGHAAPLYAYVAAVLSSFMAFFVTLMLVLQFDYPNLERVGIADFHPVTVALAFCGLLGGGVGFLWPSRWRRLAALASSAFWGFFALVFLVLLFDGQTDWVPLAQAGLAVSTAVVGALLGRLLSPRAKKPPLGGKVEES